MKTYNSINPRLLLVALISLFVAGSLSARPGRGGNEPPGLPDAERIEEMVDGLASALSLTEEQAAEVSRLYTVHFDAARKSMEQNKGGRDGGRQAMDALRKELEEQVGDVLNDEQKAKYEKLMEDRRPRQGQQGPGRR